MADRLFDRVLLPVASEKDAATTCRRLFERADEIGTIVAVHVVEKAGGGIDKAPVEQREENAEAIFAVVDEHCRGTGVDVEHRILYGTDVTETILDGADDEAASVIVFVPRESSRWANLLTGDTAYSLITETDRPVLVLPS
ncbi:universal stress protein [Halalkalicoccus sp. NIPERK01]|uniref:universal stress protein n=1 Tax=Halalkalicoccus sp. NIPERK01 TaxID=3053469 RepID=UPI00256F0788|nr:universal stress protein [Halalkalicoccus sp. NIPERK01]MDL5363054.1 universal stress protein [Halalkalicoccus sp. NIPERK01]